MRIKNIIRGSSGLGGGGLSSSSALAGALLLVVVVSPVDCVLVLALVLVVVLVVLLEADPVLDNALLLLDDDDDGWVVLAINVVAAAAEAPTIGVVLLAAPPRQWKRPRWFLFDTIISSLVGYTFARCSSVRIGLRAMAVGDKIMQSQQHSSIVERETEFSTILLVDRRLLRWYLGDDIKLCVVVVMLILCLSRYTILVWSAMVNNNVDMLSSVEDCFGFPGRSDGSNE